MSRYDELVAQMRATVKEKKSTSHSNSALQQLANTLLNTPEQEKTKIVVENDAPREVTTTPVKTHREALKHVAAQNFGIPAEELAKLDTATLPKDYTNSIVEIGTTIINDYLDTGKRFNLPMTDKHSTRMSFMKDTAPTRISETRKIEKQADGSSVSLPTGKKVKTSERTVLKASNKVPAWLKEDVE